MTIEWHLTTGPHVDILQVSGYLGDDAARRFAGAIGWALARGQGTLLLDCSRLQGWSAAGESAVAAAARELLLQERELVLVAPPAEVSGLPAYDELAHALDERRTTGIHADPGPADAWHSDRWDADSAR